MPQAGPMAINVPAKHCSTSPQPSPPLHLGSSSPCVTISMTTTSTTPPAASASHHEARTMLAKMRSASMGAIPALPLHAMGWRRNTASSMSIPSHPDHDVEIAYEERIQPKELLAKFDSGYISFPEFEEYEDSDHHEHDDGGHHHHHHMAPHSTSISKHRRR